MHTTPDVRQGTHAGSCDSRLLLLASRLTAAGLVWLALAASATPAAAREHTWLVLVVDASSSISAVEYALQKQSYVRVLSDPAMAPWLSDVAVAVVEFGSSAQVMVPFGSASEVALVYEAAGRAGQGQTNVRAGLETALALLDGRDGLRIVDISGDGPDNVNGEPCGSLASLVAVARAEMIQINALAILNEPPVCGGNAGEWYQLELQDAGFVVEAETFEDFRDALERKLRMEVALR
jgi:hypothetical protein